MGRNDRESDGKQTERIKRYGLMQLLLKGRRIVLLCPVSRGTVRSGQVDNKMAPKKV